MHWRLLHSPPHGGPENMALDAALMARARRTGETVLRVYSWSAPVLSLGRHQRARGYYDLDAARSSKVDIVRRPTGGRALLHHREITYSVTAPVVAGDGLTSVYSRINALLAESLRALGVPATIASGGARPPAPTSLPCFAEPSRGELVLDGRKLAGSAQWREDGAVLQHGSILIDDDQQMIGHLSLEPVPPVPSPATLRELLGRSPSTHELADALETTVRRTLDPVVNRLDLDDATYAEAERLVHRFRDDTWTWRR